MPTIYKPADEAVRDIAARLIPQYHPDLEAAGVTIEYLFATNANGSPLKLHGATCAAIAKIVSPKDRAKGMTDVEISIDEDRWNEKSDAEKAALLDHELHHFIVQKDTDDSAKLDPYGRPKISMRPHDVEFGWFEVIAARHKTAAPEVVQAAQIWESSAAVFFCFLGDQLELPFIEKRSALPEPRNEDDGGGEGGETPKPKRTRRKKAGSDPEPQNDGGGEGGDQG